MHHLVLVDVGYFEKLTVVLVYLPDKVVPGLEW